MTSNGAWPLMNPDKIRNEDDTAKTLSMSFECPRHTKEPQCRARPHRNRWKLVELLCGNHNLERKDYQERACQWDEQGDASIQTKHRSNSWDCRASNLPLLSFKCMGTASMLKKTCGKHRRKISIRQDISLRSACQAQYGDAILEPEKRAKEQTRCL